jgi:hypothetical protein
MRPPFAGLDKHLQMVQILLFVGRDIDHIWSFLHKMNPNFDAHNEKLLEAQRATASYHFRVTKRQEAVNIRKTYLIYLIFTNK